MSWRANKAWSDRFVPQIQQILAEHLVTVAEPEEDAQHNTDLFTLQLPGQVRIACRVRRHEYLLRYPDEFTLRCSVTPHGLRRLALTCAEGAAKYGDHNWQKGLPASSTVNHALRHINMWLMGDNSEDHLAHAAWNLLALMHFEELRPELIDIPARKDPE